MRMDNFKMDLGELEWLGMDCIGLTEDSEQ
jgi:hypothetical protein